MKRRGVRMHSLSLQRFHIGRGVWRRPSRIPCLSVYVFLLDWLFCRILAAHPHVSSFHSRANHFYSLSVEHIDFYLIVIYNDFDSTKILFTITYFGPDIFIASRVCFTSRDGHYWEMFPISILHLP